MRKGIVVTLLSALLTTGCAHYVRNGTYKEFKHPLPRELSSCLGDLTLSPDENGVLSDFELYQCAQTLYKWAETDCSQGNYLLAEQLCDDALENLERISDKRKDTLEYETLRGEVENLKRGIVQQDHCK